VGKGEVKGGRGLARLSFYGARLVLFGAAFLLAGSCATTMNGYTGPSMPPDETALIKTGFNANLLRCDDVQIPSSYLNIAVLPGKHTVQLSLRRQWIADKLLYSEAVGSVTFVAEAGHTYTVNASLLPIKEWAGLVAHEYDWQGYVKDLGSGQTIAITAEALPVRFDWIFHGSTFNNSPP